MYPFLPALISKPVRGACFFGCLFYGHSFGIVFFRLVFQFCVVVNGVGVMFLGFYCWVVRALVFSFLLDCCLAWFLCVWYVRALCVVCVPVPGPQIIGRLFARLASLLSQRCRFLQICYIYSLVLFLQVCFSFIAAQPFTNA